MHGLNCLIFAILVEFSFSHVIFPDVLETALLNLRSKRETPCGEEIDLEQTGGVNEIHLRTESFNGTEFYRVNEDCKWTLKTTQDHFMILKSDYFSVEESENCIWDYVEITEKGVDGTTSKYCGWDPLTYITFGSKIQLQFKSDETYEDKGFKFIIESSKRGGDDSKCIGSILGGEDSRIMNKDDLGEDCFYRIQAPGDKVITLDLKMLDFGSASCEEESIIIYKGQSTQGTALGTICSDTVPGILPYHASSMFIEYRNPLKQEGERFTIDYIFVEDNFTPAPVPSTTPSPVGGNNDCSRMYKGIDTDSGILVYTAPEYENNKDCIVVVRNDQLPNHVVQIEFDYFDIEESDNCIFDSLRVLSGERNDSALLGGPYCGEGLHGRTFLTRGNSLRLEFKTDVSFALQGFQAKISFVPNTECRCNGNKMCIRQDFEKKCIRGQRCEANSCQNGGTCIKTGSEATCYCPKGFQGEDCSQSDGEKSYHIRFTKAPVDRTIKRGEGHVEECEVEVPYGEEVEYNWSLQGTLIEPYNDKTGFGTHPGGVLQIDDFSDNLEGQYSCFATTSGGTAEHTFEYRIAEDCNVRIFPGPQSESKKINEMALLICRVDHRAKAVRWKKDGVYIDYDKDDRIKKMANNYLRILNVGMEDAGVYQCEAEDENGCYSYKEGKLQVVDVKSFSSYCGISIHEEAFLSSRISKGSEAPPKMYPWHVTFRSTGDASRKRAFCGGSLISQRFVVTAAHCIEEFSEIFGVDFGAKNVELLLGTTDCLGIQNDGKRRKVRSFTVHPDYEERGTFDNDIALIELDSLVEYTDDIRPICVEPAEYNDRVFLENSASFGRVIGKVAGCGKTRQKATSLPQRLRHVDIPYADRETCLESMGNDRHKLTDTMFCAGSKIGRTGDSCEGDSGGGLIMATNTRWVLTGVVSWGRGCDVDKHYGVYTNVGMFYDWIESVTKFNEEAVPDFINHN
ncbi:uncharacterized protein LOC132746360 isoform X1 [Ruditapes philippinarum]|uniref:uncharacterized protein LOC132746360 isoform X1 n=1 Tax=Ruditapes philippinarum TaxID=129788 RepID=UPI00295B81A2|nr:uncharacterized protein LOC132746360 isoform X1 [Ruditapes philippinarum]